MSSRSACAALRQPRTRVPHGLTVLGAVSAIRPLLHALIATLAPPIRAVLLAPLSHAIGLLGLALLGVPALHLAAFDLAALDVATLILATLRALSCTLARLARSAPASRPLSTALRSPPRARSALGRCSRWTRDNDRSRCWTAGFLAPARHGRRDLVAAPRAHRGFFPGDPAALGPRPAERRRALLQRWRLKLEWS